MNVPKSFKAELDKRKHQEEKEKLDEIKEEQEEKKQRKFFRKNEKSKRGEKIEICKKLFAWKDEFLKSEEGARIFNKSNQNLWVFGGSWAHEPRECGHGCWARIYFNPKNMEYWAGYKWMGAGPRYSFTKPEEMAKLNCKFLKEFLTEIENKKIFKYILELNDD